MSAPNLLDSESDPLDTRIKDPSVGVQEIKNLLAFTIALIQGSVASMADGKISFMDIFNFFQAVISAGPAIRHLDHLKTEIVNLTAEEKMYLCDYVHASIKLDNKDVQMYVDKALCLIISLLDFLPLADDPKHL